MAAQTVLTSKINYPSKQHNRLRPNFYMKNFWLKLKKPIYALAPMAGVTDSAFRQICKSFGADVVYSEMVSATALVYDSKKTLELMRFSKKERPFVAQLFGSKPELFALAANGRSFLEN